MSSKRIFIFLILFTDLFIQQITITPAGIDVDLGIAYTAWTVFFVLFFGWGVIELFVKYFDSRGIIRTQIKYILFAILATMVGAYSFNILLPLFGNYRYIHVGPFFTTVMVAIIAYAIAKHHFLDIRLVIARFFSYALLLVIFASLYSAAIFLASYIIFDFSIPPKTLVFLITLTVGISFSFQPIKKFLESATDEVFYKEGYDSEVFLKEIGNIMSATLSLDDLSQNFLEFIVKNFKISQANLILFEGKRHFKVYGFPKRAHFTEEQIRGLRRFDDGVIIFEELNKAPLGEILRQHQMTACSFLEAKGKKIGLLLLGEKLSGDVLSSQDIKVVEIMTPQAAVTVQNAQAFDEIQQFNITLNQKISHATAKLKRANVRLQELSKLKDEFVSIASHELRTPMTAIKSYLWLALNRGKLDAKTQKNLGRAFDSTERTINLVKDMLTVSRIEGRRLDVNKVPFDLVDLAKQIYNDLKIQAEEKQINFSYQISKYFPAGSNYYLQVAVFSSREDLLAGDKFLKIKIENPDRTEKFIFLDSQKSQVFGKDKMWALQEGAVFDYDSEYQPVKLGTSIMMQLPEQNKKIVPEQPPVPAELKPPAGVLKNQVKVVIFSSNLGEEIQNPSLRIVSYRYGAPLKEISSKIVQWDSNFAKNSSSSFEIILPLFKDPGAYETFIQFFDGEEKISNPLGIRYITAGDSGLIYDFLVEEKSAGNFILNVLFTAPADTYVRDLTKDIPAQLIFTAKEEKTNKICLSKMVDVNLKIPKLIQEPFVLENCSSPLAFEAQLKKDGQILDEQKTIVQVSQFPQPKKNYLPIIIGLTILILGGISFWLFKKFKKEKLPPTIGLFIIIFIISLIWIFSPLSARADTPRAFGSGAHTWSSECDSGANSPWCYQGQFDYEGGGPDCKWFSRTSPLSWWGTCDYFTQVCPPGSDGTDCWWESGTYFGINRVDPSYRWQWHNNWSQFRFNDGSDSDASPNRFLYYVSTAFGAWAAQDYSINYSYNSAESYFNVPASDSNFSWYAAFHAAPNCGNGGRAGQGSMTAFILDSGGNVVKQLSTPPNWAITYPEGDAGYWFNLPLSGLTLNKKYTLKIQDYKLFMGGQNDPDYQTFAYVSADFCYGNCANPKGWHDWSDCNQSMGWACDADNYNQVLDIYFYRDGPAGGGGVFLGSVSANQPREAGVGAACGGNSNHGFVFNTPDSLKDGAAHTIYAYAINIGSGDTNPLLSSSPKTITCTLTNNAACGGISAPDSVTVGQTFSATVTMNNNGTKPWTTDGTPHNLGSQNPQDNTRWGIGRVGLSSASVSPGQQTTFSFTATAPATTGSYPFDWKMVEDGIEWFGGTCAKNITVTAAPKPHIVLNPTAFTFNGVSGGATPAGKTLQISNTGNATLNWAGSLNQGWCHLSSGSGSVSAGNSQNVTVSVDAPSNIGSFNCVITISDANADNSPQTASVTYTVTAALPAAPSNAAASISSCSQINVSWQDNSNNEDGFKIERKTDATSWTQIATVGANITSYPDSGLAENTKYYYRVRADNANGDSGYSNETNGTTPACPIVDIKGRKDASQSFSDGPITIDLGKDIELQWSSTGVDTCTASGGWSGSKPTSGSETISNLTKSSIYGITCSGVSGSSFDSLNVNISFKPWWREIIPW